MALNSTEGRTIFGWVVAGDDNSPDPQGLGRVKILNPSSHPSVKIEDLPWSQVTSPASGTGTNSFNRPPPMGSVVEIFYPPGSKSSGHGIIKGVLHGVHNPDDLDSGKKNGQNFTRTGWLDAARKTAPKNSSGVATVKQTGGSAAKAEPTYKPAPSLEDRVGTDTSGASKAFIRTNKGMTSVAGASQWNYFIHDPDGTTGQPKVQLPGEDPDFTEACLAWQTGKDLLTKGLHNMSKLRPEYKSDNTGMNFCYQGNKTIKGAAAGTAGTSTGDLLSSLTGGGGSSGSLTDSLISGVTGGNNSDLTTTLATAMLTGGVPGLTGLATQILTDQFGSLLNGGIGNLLTGGLGGLFGGGGPPPAWEAEASARMKSVSNQSDLMDAIHEVNTWDFYDKGLKTAEDQTVTFTGAFDKVQVQKKITPSGKITIENKDAIGAENQKFNDIVIGGGVATGKTTGGVSKGSDPDTGAPILKLSGGLFSGSGTKGPSGDMMMRLNIGTQQAIKQSLHAFATDSNQFAINFQFARFGSGEGCTRDPDPGSVSIS